MRPFNKVLMKDCFISTNEASTSSKIQRFLSLVSKSNIAGLSNVFRSLFLKQKQLCIYLFLSCYILQLNNGHLRIIIRTSIFFHALILLQEIKGNNWSVPTKKKKFKIQKYNESKGSIRLEGLHTSEMGNLHPIPTTTEIVLVHSNYDEPIEFHLATYFPNKQGIAQKILHR